MKRLAFVMVFVLLIAFGCTAISDPSQDWTEAPTITKVYELQTEKLYIEWEGNAVLYQIRMDGERVAESSVNNILIPVSKGTHTIIVYPVTVMNPDDEKTGFSIEGFGGIGINLSGIDLSALGISQKDLIYGNPSAPINVDYKINAIFSAMPSNITAVTGDKNRVIISFLDRYNADEYIINIKSGRDIQDVRFNVFDGEANQYIKKDNSTVSIILDQEYLNKKGCMVPEMNEKYSFSVQLRKSPVDIVSGEPVKTVMHESKVSGWFDYTPIEAWKSAPVIVFCSQMADCEVQIKWEHESYDTVCEYEIRRINKTLGITRGSDLIGTTNEHEYTIQDLNNGNYCFAVVPTYGRVEGAKSANVDVEVKNEWVVAPSLACETVLPNIVMLSWQAPANIESYHITVYKGDSGSLLRFIDMDFDKYTEFDVDSVEGAMEYTYIYDEDIDPDDGIKLKFEIFGIRHDLSGKEQVSSSSSQIVNLK